MKNCNMILSEKHKKIPALSSGKINKFEYLSSNGILLSN